MHCVSSAKNNRMSCHCVEVLDSSSFSDSSAASSAASSQEYCSLNRPNASSAHYSSLTMLNHKSCVQMPPPRKLERRTKSQRGAARDTQATRDSDVVMPLTCVYESHRRYVHAVVMAEITVCAEIKTASREDEWKTMDYVFLAISEI